MKTNKKRYQVVMVLNPKMKEKDRDVLLAKISDEIVKEGVKVKGKEHWGMKDFVYKIGGFEKGDFWIFDVLGRNGLELVDLNIYFNRQKDIIRYLVLKV